MNINELLQLLDDNLETPEERTELVNKIFSDNLDFFTSEENQSQINKLSEIMANYILKKVKDDDLISDYQEKNLIKKEMLIEEPDENIKVKFEQKGYMPKYEKSQRGYKKASSSLSEREINKFFETKQIEETCNEILELIKKGEYPNGEKISTRDRKILMKTKIELKKDQKIAYKLLARVVYFNSIMKPEPNHSDLEHFDFGDKKQVLAFLETFDVLQKKQEKESGTWYKIISIVFNQIAEEALKSNFEKDILYLKMNGFDYNEITEVLKSKYNCDFSYHNVRRSFVDSIPKKISDHYNEQVRIYEVLSGKKVGL